MMEQRLCETQDVNIQSELKNVHLPSSQAYHQKDKPKDFQAKQPIIRIHQDFLNLQYKVNEIAYKTTGQLLIHTKIRPQDRQKLKSWMLSETQNIYERETYAMASKFLDMFFSRGYRVQKNLFQVLGIACLILATKVNQRRVPSISFQVFDKNQIFGFQRTLLEIFNFKVNPPTYVSVSQLLLYFWDHYETENNPYDSIKYYKEGIQSIKMIRSIMETLDCMDLVHQTLNISLCTLVCHVFFIQNRKNALLKLRKQNQYKLLVQADDYDPFHEKYTKFMTDFLKQVQKISPVFIGVQINQKFLAYTMCFSRINPKVKVNPKFKHFVFEVNRQTYNPEITLIAQNYLNKKLLV